MPVQLGTWFLLSFSSIYFSNKFEAGKRRNQQSAKLREKATMNAKPQRPLWLSNRFEDGSLGAELCGLDILSIPRGSAQRVADPPGPCPARSKITHRPGWPETSTKVFNEVSIDFGCHSPQNPARLARMFSDPTRPAEKA